MGPATTWLRDWWMDLPLHVTRDFENVLVTDNLWRALKSEYEQDPDNPWAMSWHEWQVNGVMITEHNGNALFAITNPMGWAAQPILRDGKGDPYNEEVEDVVD